MSVKPDTGLPPPTSVEPDRSPPFSASSRFGKYKLVFLGDTRVGKTSIITRYMYDNFEHDHHPTIGIDFLSKTVYLSDRAVRLQLWDTAGQERFRSLIPSYIRDSNIAVVVYDVTNRTSFLNTTQWMADVRRERGEDVVICLVGNKTDLGNKRRQVGEGEGAEQARKEGVIFMECSAKSGHNVRNLFRQLAATLGGSGEDRSGRVNDDDVVNLPARPTSSKEANGCAC